MTRSWLGTFGVEICELILSMAPVIYTFLFTNSSCRGIPRSMIPATGSREMLKERSGKVTGSFRKTPEIAGTWRQYSDRKLSGFFPVDSCQFPVLSGRNQPEIIKKKWDNFPAGILLPRNHRNYPEPAVSAPGCLTLVASYFSSEFFFSFSSLGWWFISKWNKLFYYLKQQELTIIILFWWFFELD